MRVVNSNFANFANFSRFAPEFVQSFDPKAKILIDLFLDNPVLLASHRDLFDNGMNSFNKTAEFINNIKPDIKWISLGTIAQHAYLERLREDGNYDIFTFSSNFILENIHAKTATYYIRKEESFQPPLKSTTVDGQNLSYEENNYSITTTLTIPAGEKRHIVIEYSNDLDFSTIDISKNNFHATILRYLSDFRDIVIPKSALGQWFVKKYYTYKIHKLGLIGVVVLVIFPTGFVIFTVYFFFKRNSTNRSRNQEKI